MQNFRLPHQSKYGKPNQILKILSNHSTKDCFIRLFNVDKMIPLSISNIFQKPIDNIPVSMGSNKTKLVSNKIKELNTIKFCDMTKFSTKGPFLGQKMNIVTIHKFAEYKKYLYLIPCQNDRNIWLSVGMAIKNCGGTIDDFILFSKLNSEIYVENECDVFHGFKLSDTCYGLETLKKYAILANKLLFDQFEQLSKLDDYFYIDESNLNVIIENSRYVSCTYNPETKEHIFNDNMISLDKFLIVDAFLGSGKTTANVNFLKKMDYKTILFLSPRITFTYFLIDEFKEFFIKDYHEITGEITDDVVACQLESILRIHEDKIYDCIIMDESESILKQYSSSTMRQIRSNFTKLNKLIKNAKKVVCSDAFLTRRTFNFCKSFNSGITLLRNTNPPDTKSAYLVSEATLDQRIINELKENKNLYVFFSSAKKLVKFKNKFEDVKKTDDKLINKTTNFYYKGVNDIGFKKDFIDINNSWLKNLICTSPITTVGCSFSTKNHFNAVYVKSQPTCTPRDVMQAMFRVRHTIDNELYYSFSKDFNNPTNKINNENKLKLKNFYEEYIKSTDANKKLNLQIAKELQRTDEFKLDENLIDIIHILEDEKNATPPNLLDILVFNHYEDMLSKCHYNLLFTHMLKICGYDLKTSNKKIVNELMDKENDNNYEQLFLAIKTLNDTEFETTKNKIKAKLATEDDKITCNKKCFLKKVDPLTPIKTLSTLYFEIYCDSFSKHIIDNIYYYKNKTIPELMIYDLENKEAIADVQSKHASRLFYIKQLNTFMGLKHCQDTDTIICKDIVKSKVYPFLLKHYDDLNNTFSLTKKEILDDDETKKNTLLFHLLKNIYKKYSGCFLVVGEQNKKTHTATNYILTGFNFYDHIVVRKK
jgi:hypothetical protein